MILGIYGAGGLAMECSSLAEKINAETKHWTSFVFILDEAYRTGEADTLLDYPIMSFEKTLETYGKEELEFIVGVGEVSAKQVIFEKLKANGCRITNLIHPETSIHRSVKLGEGVMIGRNAAIAPMVTIGNNVLIRGNTVIGHDAVLGDNIEQCAFSIIGGHNVIGSNTFIGLHSCLREDIKVGDHVIIGMGSIVTKDVPANVVIYGNPARVVRNNDNSKVFKQNR